MQRGTAAAGPVVFSYPAAQNSEWDMVGQNLGKTLAPGESVETFIPSDPEGLEWLSGDLEWRFHLRKGYAPSGRGVTTLVEVTFGRDEVQPEARTGKAAAYQRQTAVPEAVGNGKKGTGVEGDAAAGVSGSTIASPLPPFPFSPLPGHSRRVPLA